MMCPNGHPVAEHSAYCETCGAAVSERQSANDQPGRATPTLGALSPMGGRQISRNAIAIALTLSVLVVGAIGVIAATAGSNGNGAGSSDSADQPASSDHDICVRQMLAIATDLLVNSGSGHFTEQHVNTPTDDYYYRAQDILRSLGQYADPSTITDAQKDQAEAQAASLCSEDLGNQVRPNYPTDGSYPDPSIEFGSDPDFQPGVPPNYECPPGTSITNRVNGDGDYICE